MLFTATSLQQEAPADTTQKIGCRDIRQCEQSELVAEQLLSPRGLGKLTDGHDKHFYSNGAFNLVQLVLYMLRQTGPAHVFISSYSIAEQSLAMLRRKLDKGELLSIRFLIDNRVRTISPKPFDYLVTAFAGCYRCCALHAKVALVWNDTHHWTLVGSQNATNNPKLERGIIHTRREIFDFDYQHLTHEFDQGTD
ncbi:MAG: hypothetical protein K5778_01795 [Bacteroidaceae bacterium]|nr:hypothetical protein [Bacteroidaceae bacterium]